MEEMMKQQAEIQKSLSNSNHKSTSSAPDQPLADNFPFNDPWMFQRMNDETSSNSKVDNCGDLLSKVEHLSIQIEILNKKLDRSKKN